MDNSSSETAHTRRTHTSTAIVEALKKLPRTRHLDNAVTYPDILSDDESLVTVNEEAPLSPASGFKKVINSLSPALAISIMRSISSFGGNAKHPRDGEDPKPPSKRRCEEIDLPVGSRPPVSFNVLLKDLDVHGYYINLDYINKNSSSIATTKLNAPGSDKQTRVMDSAHFEANVLAERDLDWAQWTEAAQNYIKFMGIIGTPDVPHWTADLGFLVTYEKAEKNFPALLRTDITLHQAYNVQGFSFKREFYQEQLSNKLVLLRIDENLELRSAEWKPVAETRPPAAPPSLHGGIRSGGGGGGRGSGGTRGGARIIGRGGPFQEGSGGEAPSTVCLLCARQGHYYSTCTSTSFEDGSTGFEDGSPLFCRNSGNDICTIRSNETLCCLCA
ncbi:hypothetical protein DFH08DRAFT_962223 [Mycena albidolilacea]|uniref:Uncharacterized protein n=1 Tax=Mycena albidolilacea TaxID=1033008 RepID=A0AAD6ZZR2_9AGAR|nr:hypothetical protein DFH08DRAFT_962223 [Mycena albidolilacea]